MTRTSTTMRDGRHARFGMAWLMRSVAGAAAGVALAAMPAQGQEFAHNIIVPQSRVIVAPDHQQPVSIQRVETTIDIHGQVATTTLRVILHNPAGRAQEAEVVMPVPEGVAIRYFQLEGLGDDGGAKLLPKDQARAVYEAIVRRMIDPAILEFAGCGMIRSNVFPVPAGEESVIKLVYEQLLTAEGERIDYVLPRAQGATGAEWSITVNVDDESLAGVYSPTHDLSVRGEGGAVIPAGGGVAPGVKSYSVVNAAQSGGSFQFTVLRQPDEGEMGITFLAYPDARVTNGTQTGGYFLMLGGVPKPQTPERFISREITLVIDRSGSMRGEKMTQAQSAAAQIVGALTEHDVFNIIDYSDNVASFAEAPVAATRENLSKAIAYIDAIRPIGGTNIHDAVVEALRQPAQEGRLGMVLFLTDGLPTIGQTTEQAIRSAAQANNKHERRVFTFGVGFDVNTPLLRAIATDSRATATFVQPGEDVEAKVGQVYRRLQGPVLAGPVFSATSRLAGTPRLVDLLPSALPDVFEGEQVIVMGKYYGDEPVQVSIAGNYLGQERAFTATFDPSKATTRNAYVPRLWATRRIGTLLDAIRQSPGSEGHGELVDEIIALSTEFGILTEYTAFLAANPEDMPAGVDGVPALLPAAPGEWRDQSEARRGLERSIRARNDVRAGAGSMNQEVNNGGRAEAQSLAAGRNEYLDATMATREITTVQQVNERAYFQQGRRWVDSSMLAQAGEEPQQRVEFGTEAYTRLLDELIVDNRQAVLANRGEIYMLHRGQRVLVINPG